MILLLLSFVYTILIIPFPYRGNGILLYGFVYTIIMVVANRGHISLSFQDISMKLGGHMGHGPNSSYHDVCHAVMLSCCHAVIEL